VYRAGISISGGKMKATALTLVLTCLPGVVVAQTSASASSTTQANVTVPASYSASAKADIEAAFERARAKNLPDRPLRQRMAEGQAKGASEAQVATAVQKMEARLEATQSAMIRAGRKHPSPDEVTAGEQAMARGATEAHIEALAKRAPSDRSLTVAFDVLTRLEAQGKPVDKALAVIQAKLDARASDEALMSLAGGADALLGNGNASAKGSAAAAANAHGKNGNAAGAAATAAGNAAAGVSGAVKGAAGSTAGVGAIVTGAVSGAVGKRP
jgi:hypothetical protein